MRDSLPLHVLVCIAAQYRRAVDLCVAKRVAMWCPPIPSLPLLLAEKDVHATFLTQVIKMFFQGTASMAI